MHVHRRGYEYHSYLKFGYHVHSRRNLYFHSVKRSNGNVKCELSEVYMNENDQCGLLTVRWQKNYKS